MQIQKGLRKLGIGIFLGLAWMSCEDDLDESGYDLLANNPADGERTFLDLIAYNLDNNDSIRSDENVLFSGVLGAYSEGIFGRVKANYVSQVRLSSINPSFSDSINSDGTPEAEVDSVSFFFTPSYSQSSDDVSIDTLYTDMNGDRYDQVLDDDVDTFRIVTKYPITNKYGDHADFFNLKVYTINEFLYSVDSTFYSNHTVTPKDFLGEGIIRDSLTGIQFRNTNGSTVTEINENEVADVSPSVRISLDKDFFQDNFLDKQGDVELSDQARFIRFINGIFLETQEDDAFMINFTPASLNLRIYFTYKTKKTEYTDSEGNVTDTIYTRTSNFDLSFSNSYNVRIGLYDFDRSPGILSTIPSDMVLGNEKLYLQGLGGPRTVIQLDETQLDAFKDEFINNKRSIVGAKLKFYIADEVDEDELPYPSKLTGLVYDNDIPPSSVMDLGYNDFEFFRDISVFSLLAGYSFNPTYDSDDDPGYFELNITEHLKNIVEKDSVNRPLMVDLGDFVINQNNGTYYGPLYTSRPYVPNRMVFYGNAYADDTKKLKVEVLYTIQN